MKLTGPLFSHFAHGTLGSTVQFRRCPGGTIALRSPRPNRDVCRTLRSYAEILKISHSLMKLLEPQTSEFYTAFADANQISNRAAYLHFSLSRWKNFLPLPDTDPNAEDPEPTPPATISWNLIHDDHYDMISMEPWDLTHISTLHVLSTSIEEPSPKNCFHAHILSDPQTWIRKPTFPTGTVWIQAVTWWLNGINPSLSNKLQILV